MGRPEKFTPDQVIAALRDNYGLVYPSAQQLHCEPTTVYRYIKTYASVRAEAKAQDTRLADLGEKTLIECVEDREAWAIATLLKAKARDRGYGDKASYEISGPGGGPVQHEHRVSLTTYAEYFAQLGSDGALALSDGHGADEPLDPAPSNGQTGALPDGG